MKGLLNWLNRPYPYDKSPGKKFRTGFLISLFVFLFLYLFQPFGLDYYFPYKPLVISGYGGITFLAYAIIGFLVPVVLPKTFQEEKWTVRKELILNICLLLVIALGNYFYTALMGYTRWDWAIALKFGFFTLLVGIFPLTLGVLIRQINTLKKYQLASNAINHDLEQPTVSPTPSLPSTVDLTNEEGKVEINLPPSAILFMAAADNYVEVHFEKDNQVEKHLIRSSLSRLVDLLPDDFFFRCHRSYAVNFSKVVHVEGNSAGLRLTLANDVPTVPVSRSKAKEFQSKIAALK